MKALDSYAPTKELSQQAPQPSDRKEPDKTVARKRSSRPRVVIVGAGFGGLNAALQLAGKDVDVMVVDRNNYHGFWPLLYQVATAGLESESIAYPVRAILSKHRNIGFMMATVERIDFDRRIVYTDGRTLTYDYLILAAGSTNNYFGNDALAKQTYGLKDIDEAERLRNRVLYSFEQAFIERNPEKRRALMTFVLIGGGPTGVELAGALSELINHVLNKDYPSLDTEHARVVLVEATDRILAAFPESLQASAKGKLESMGVEIRFNSPVASVEDGLITFKDGSQLQASTVVWAAGVRSSALVDALDVPTGKNLRVKVEPALHLAEHPEIFVVGDMAYLEGYKEGQPYPMVAQVAIQQGQQAARNILRHANKQEMKPFHYFDKGNMATIGRRAAVLDAFGLHLSGRLAWLGWLLIHIYYLIGFRNRLIVLTNWVFNYFAFERGVRLITNRNWPR